MRIFSHHEVREACMSHILALGNLLPVGDRACVQQGFIEKKNFRYSQVTRSRLE